MRIPYVIDNQTRKLADVLNALLAEHVSHSLDVATAYFEVGAYRLLDSLRPSSRGRRG